MEKRACKHCHHFFTPFRNPHQYVCSRRLCQNMRKVSWRRTKHGQDPDYRENQRHASQRWRKKHPEYWRDYRITHPSYTNRNREKERQRRLHKRLVCGSDASGVANSDALTAKNPVKPGTYQLVPLSHGGVANSDALIVKISLLTSTSEQMVGRCKHTTL